MYVYTQLVVLFVTGADETVHRETTVHVFYLKVGWDGVLFTYEILLEGYRNKKYNTAILDLYNISIATGFNFCLRIVYLFYLVI